MAGHEPATRRRSIARRGLRASLALRARKPLAGLRIGLPREYSGRRRRRCRGRDRGGARQFAQARRDNGRCRASELKLSVPVYYVIAPAEASSNLSRFDGVRYGYRAARTPISRHVRKTRAEGFGAEVKRRISSALRAVARLLRRVYLKAQQVRRLIARGFRARVAECDVIVGPTTPTAAFGSA